MSEVVAPLLTTFQAMQQMRYCLEALETKREGPQTFSEAVCIEMASAYAILLHKHHLRGVDNLKDQGVFGIVSRMANDKMARLLREAKLITMRQWIKELNLDPPDWQAMADVKESGDGFTDDLIDVENYSILCRMLLSGDLDLPDGRY